MTQETRRPTKEDFLNKRSFCIVHLEAGDTELSATLLRRKAFIEEDRGGNLRINPHGVIGYITLGEFHPQSAGPYGASGVMIDYSENETQLLERARSQLQSMRAAYLERLREHIRRQEAVEIRVTA